MPLRSRWVSHSQYFNANNIYNLWSLRLLKCSGLRSQPQISWMVSPWVRKCIGQFNPFKTNRRERSTVWLWKRYWPILCFNLRPSASCFTSRHLHFQHTAKPQFYSHIHLLASCDLNSSWSKINIVSLLSFIGLELSM